MKKITFKTAQEAILNSGLECKFVPETEETYGVIKYLLSDSMEFTMVFEHDICVDYYCKAI